MRGRGLWPLVFAPAIHLLTGHHHSVVIKEGEVEEEGGEELHEVAEGLEMLLSLLSMEVFLEQFHVHCLMGMVRARM